MNKKEKNVIFLKCRLLGNVKSNYNDIVLEIINELIYLGVLFSRTCLLTFF